MRSFGEETYYAKVDAALPDRAARRWEKRGERNGGPGVASMEML